MMKHVNVSLFVVNRGCPHMCSFCDQKSITGCSSTAGADDVHSAVKTALGSLTEAQAAGGEIAFFGGSFTMVKRDYMLSLLEAAYPYVKKGLFKGIRISTRPDGINEEICTLLKSYGVTAVELGAQSLDDRVLTMNDRGHTAKDVADAVKMLKAFGFETGLQMMTGLYGSEDEDCIKTAEKIIALRPDTVRIYPTVVLKNTRLEKLMNEGLFVPKGVEESVRLCGRLIEMFEKENIRIIRVGLHSGGDVNDNFVGGAYHPAFKELCENEIYLKKAVSALSPLPKGQYTLTVGTGMVSKMSGQGKKNLKELEKLGYTCKILQNDAIKKYELKIGGTEK